MSNTPRSFDIFVICAPGLEAVVRGEMLRLGVTPTNSESGGISCAGSLSDVMRLNLWLRAASRVVIRIASFHASTFYEMERRAKKIDWKPFLSASSTISFRVTCRKSKLYHSDAVAERLFNSVKLQLPGVKQQSSEEGDDEDLPGGEAQKFIIRLFRDDVTVSVDSSGDLLHRRGYRLATAKAPIRETLAAGMLLAAGWAGRDTLLDPLCGSGTFPIEAALIARNIAPGAKRVFAFMNWRNFERSEWDTMLAKAGADALPESPARIIASDRDEGAVKATSANAERAGVVNDISVGRASMTEAIEAVGGTAGNGVLVANPPYGKRVGEGADPRDLYSSLGRAVRSNLPGWSLLIVSNESRLISQLGIPVETLFSASNGGIPVQIVKGLVPGLRP